MLKWLNLLCALSIAVLGNSQDSLTIITWEQALKASPDTVFAIDASHLKWEQIPAELFQFKKLTYLDLSKNKLSSLPDELGTLKALTKLNVTKNDLEGSPTVVCQLTALKYLGLARNKITSLPPCIGYLSQLQVLDIWDNPMNVLPNELASCSKLKAVDMRGILLSPGFQDKWRAQMPKVTWYFDAPCHCVD